MPAYFAMRHVSWSLAHIVMNKFNHRAEALQRFAVPVIAAFIMVMWNLSMHPSRALLSQAWNWHLNIICSRAVFESLGLAAIFTMGLVGCLANFSMRLARQLH